MASFDDSSLQWSELTKDVSVPKAFSIEEITRYLTHIPVTFKSNRNAEDSDEEEEADAGTRKPAAKGIVFI